MATVSEMQRRFEAFDAIAAARKAIEDNEQAVLDKNRKQIYEEGVDSQGQRLPTYAGALGATSSLANSYFRAKQASNPRIKSNPSYDLTDTGQTLRTLTLRTTATEYSIIPQTSYAYEPAGYLPYGNTQKSKNELWIERVKSVVVDQLAAATGCTTI